MADLPEIPDSLIEYPSDFPIKVMGAHHPDFVAVLTEVVLRHDPGFDPESVEKRPSSGGNYVGLTFIVRATSREQLDALYRELTSHPMVKYVL
ncbi:MAG: hypothetical protein ABS43_14325 [Bordetella sp. SCN 67-23]|nr:DUF493 family protein [Burkholderiales bacterium]ODS73294.1 MAG: hypothetical protein ABS43_14325 [Bordetella sp. SCN 67-23]ODU84540.1 MAG: hypothetical protein ABT00_09980 [Bordetella sp. SCN 68-11]OJW92824.1 MAG: DUF493 domain-containing protein [Burkholderiales bacterium 67-32]